MVSVWTKQHYNAIAKEIRELFPPYDAGYEQGWDNPRKRELMAKRAILTTLAISLATRFLEDNPNFSPLVFLAACSPDTSMFPLSELWENHE